MCDDELCGIWMHHIDGIDERVDYLRGIEQSENEKRRPKCEFFAVLEGLAAQVVLSGIFPSLNGENESCEREWTSV